MERCSKPRKERMGQVKTFPCQTKKNQGFFYYEHGSWYKTYYKKRIHTCHRLLWAAKRGRCRATRCNTLNKLTF